MCGVRVYLCLLFCAIVVQCHMVCGDACKVSGQICVPRREHVLDPWPVYKEEIRQSKHIVRASCFFTMLSDTCRSTLMLHKKPLSACT
jgi:hypothetical protein